jgi:hypothetical protein
MFPAGVQITPELVSYVHGRVLEIIPSLVDEFTAALASIDTTHMQPHNIAAAVSNATRAASSTPQAATCPAGYRLTAKAGAAPFATYHAAGWTVATMLAEGYLEQVP